MESFHDGDFMKNKKLSAAISAAVFALAAMPASATELLSESFDDISALQAQGWLLKNESVSLGLVPEGWFQGDASGYIFLPQSGAGYLASNFNAASENGQMADWLITPTFSTSTAGDVTFWLRGDDFPGYQDQVAFGFSNGSDATADFTMLSPQIVQAGAWNKMTVSFAAGAPASIGRFAIEHVGSQALANYIGVDTLSIDTAEASAVPEPSTLSLIHSDAADD
jgi:hypothetical protein